MTSRHISVAISRPADAVYTYASDPRHLPEWAAGLSGAEIHAVDRAWVTASPMGDISIEFAPDNPYGILDHRVTMPSGDIVYNPMRVIEDGLGCEVVFTLRQRPDMNDDEFARDADAVAKDLATLRDLMEAS